MGSVPDSPAPKSNLAAVAGFGDLAGAEITRALLEQHGLLACVVAEPLGRLGTMVDGVELRVAQTDLAAARQLLAPDLG